MGPDSLPPIEGETKTQSTGVWLLACTVFIAGLAAGVLIPAGMKLLGFWGESRPKSSLATQGAAVMPLPNGKLRKVEAPISNQPIPSTISLVAAAPAAVAKVEKKRSSQLELKLSAHSGPSDKISKKKTKNPEASDKRLLAKESKAQNTSVTEPKALVEKKTSKIKSAPIEERKSVATEKKQATPTPTAELIEEVPSALSAQQVQKFMHNNNFVQKNNTALARPVSLPPALALNQAYPAQARPSMPLPIMKSDPKTEGKTYPVTINNASFSKATLGSCGRRCALLGMDALGNPIKAVIDGPTFAGALLQHNGTINISGQPRIIKNQQVLVVENITFNLSASPKIATSKTIRSRQTASAVAPIPGPDAAGYTEIPADADDLKPGTVIKSRKQIPNEGLDDAENFEGNP